MSSIQNSEVVFDYMEPAEAFSEELRQIEKERTERLGKSMNARSAVSILPALQRFFARMHFVRSKTSVSRRSRPDSATPFKGLRQDTLASMLSTLSANGTRLCFAFNLRLDA
jgi:hypothetical protein